jgi:DNA-binding response OmpR family regulator
VDERVEGLEAGAGDYLPKPFKFKGLLVRVRAVLRRRTTAAGRTSRQARDGVAACAGGRRDGIMPRRRARGSVRPRDGS